MGMKEGHGRRDGTDRRPSDDRARVTKRRPHTHSLHVRSVIGDRLPILPRAERATARLDLSVAVAEVSGTAPRTRGAICRLGCMAWSGPCSTCA